MNTSGERKENSRKIRVNSMATSEKKVLDLDSDIRKCIAYYKSGCFSSAFGNLEFSALRFFSTEL